MIGALLLSCGGGATAPAPAATSTTLVITGLPSPAPGWTQQPLGLTVKDGSGNTVTDYKGTVHFTSSDPIAVLPPDYTFVTGDSGTFSIDCGRSACHGANITFKTAGTQTVTATDVANASITGRKTVTVGLARCALIPPPWTQLCKPPPLVFITNQRPDSVVVFQIFNAGDQGEYMLAANSTLCAYAFETFNSYLGVVDDSAYFKVTTTQFTEKATSGWTAADSTPTSLIWRAASDSALHLTVFSDTTAQGRWHLGTSFVPACSGAQP
jgi:hypothetical protein